PAISLELRRAASSRPGAPAPREPAVSLFREHRQRSAVFCNGRRAGFGGKTENLQVLDVSANHLKGAASAAGIELVGPPARDPVRPPTPAPFAPPFWLER